MGPQVGSARPIWWTFWTDYLSDVFGPWWTARHVPVRQDRPGLSVGPGSSAWTRS